MTGLHGEKFANPSPHQPTAYTGAAGLRLTMARPRLAPALPRVADSTVDDDAVLRDAILDGLERDRLRLRKRESRQRPESLEAVAVMERVGDVEGDGTQFAPDTSGVLEGELAEQRGRSAAAAVANGRPVARQKAAGLVPSG